MAIAKNHLPDDIIVEIVLRLPPKSVILFSCVSKHWRYIIMSHPIFAQTHKTLSRRLLFSTSSQLRSLSLAAPLFGDEFSVTGPSEKPGNSFKILGSCRGLVCISCMEYHLDFYMFNPSTGFFRRLPNISGFSLIKMINISEYRYHGFGYVSGTDDYKLILGIDFLYKVEGVMFSSRTENWERIIAPLDERRYGKLQNSQGIFLNEALHWLTEINGRNEQSMLAFDLAKEEFRGVPLPLWENDMYFQHLGVVGGCLCVSRCKRGASDSVDFWVMREYDAGESWSPLFKLKVFDSPERTSNFKPVFVSESSIVVARRCTLNDMELIMFEIEDEMLDHDNNDKVAVCSDQHKVLKGCGDFCDFIEYYKSSHQGKRALKTQNNGKRLETQHKGKRLKTQHMGIYLQ